MLNNLNLDYHCPQLFCHYQICSFLSLHVSFQAFLLFSDNAFEPPDNDMHSLLLGINLQGVLPCLLTPCHLGKSLLKYLHMPSNLDQLALYKLCIPTLCHIHWRNKVVKIPFIALYTSVHVYHEPILKQNPLPWYIKVRSWKPNHPTPSQETC